MAKSKKPKQTWQNGDDAMKRGKRKKKPVPSPTWQDGNDAQKHNQSDLIDKGMPQHNPPDPTEPAPEALVYTLVKTAMNGEFSVSDTAWLKDSFESQIKSGGLYLELLSEKVKAANEELASAGNIYRVILHSYTKHEKPTHVGAIITYHAKLGILNSVTATEVGNPAEFGGTVVDSII